MRSDEALLLDMLIASEKILRFTKGFTQLEFAESELVQSAVIREFQVIGEATRMLSDDAKSVYNMIAWQAIAGMRNRLIHEYFAIRLDLVWQAISEDIPDLIEKLKAIVPDEDDEEDQ